MLFTEIFHLLSHLRSITTKPVNNTQVNEDSCFFGLRKGMLRTATWPLFCSAALEKDCLEQENGHCFMLLH